MKYNYLAIEGNIGAGKTSLATMIAEKYHRKLILEQFEENPFLIEFYKNPNKYALPLELSFLSMRYHQLSRELKAPGLSGSLKVTDYFFSKSLIFAKVTLQPADFNMYRHLYMMLDYDLPKPDLLIYLSLSVGQLMHHIKVRGREYEKNISGEYLQKVQDSYMSFIHLQQDMKILIVELDNINFIDNTEDFNKIEEVILQTRVNSGINRVLIS